MTIPKCHQFITNFVKDFNVNSSIKCSVERRMESVPQTVESEARLIVVLDGLNSREFSFVD